MKKRQSRKRQRQAAAIGARKVQNNRARRAVIRFSAEWHSTQPDTTEGRSRNNAKLVAAILTLIGALLGCVAAYGQAVNTVLHHYWHIK